MRITTQMLNQSAKKAGIALPGNSLLDYLNKDNSDGSLLSALNKGSGTNQAQKSSFEKLAKTSDELKQSKNNLAAAIKSGDSKEIYSEAKSFADNYNETLKLLSKNSSGLNSFYKQMMKEATLESSDALKSIGFSVAQDGSISINENALKAADSATLEKALGASSNFMQKVGYISGKVSNNAEATVDSLGSQYSENGNAYSAYNSNKYDFWG